MSIYLSHGGVDTRAVACDTSEFYQALLCKAELLQPYLSLWHTPANSQYELPIYHDKKKMTQNVVKMKHNSIFLPWSTR